MVTTRSIVITFIGIILASILIMQYYFRQQSKIVAPPQIWRIAFLMNDKDVQSDNIKGFKDGMKDLGYIEGKNITYTEKMAGADKTLLSKYAEELNASGYDLIVVVSTSAATALKNLSDLKIKVFFLSAGRPRDIVKNLQAPEGLFTGIGEGTVEFSGKRIEFIKQVVPSIKRIIAIVEKTQGNVPLFKEKTEEAAKILGVKMIFVEINNTDDLPSKIHLLTLQNADAFLGAPVQSNQKYAKEVEQQLLKEKMPSINDEVFLGANIGYLITYSDDRYKTGKYAAERVDRILKGMPISQVPVEFAKDVNLQINLKTAEAIGIKIPSQILLRANKVYNE